MKFGFKQLLHPTPAKVKAFGKAMRTAAVSAAAIAATAGSGVAISIALVAAGFIGDFLCDFFGADDAQPSAKPEAVEPVDSTDK